MFGVACRLAVDSVPYDLSSVFNGVSLSFLTIAGGECEWPVSLVLLKSDWKIRYIVIDNI